MDENMKRLLDLEENLKHTKNAVNTIITRISRGEKVVCGFLFKGNSSLYITFF